MAGSRLEKLGTVFTRTRDLIRAGVIKQNEKPIWYDVYAAFPPKREPSYVSPPKRRPKPVDNVPAIFYKEDIIRAKFYDTYGSPGMLNLNRSDYKSTCQKFVEEYLELQKSGVVSEENLFEETGKALLSQGVILRRSGVTTVSNQPSSASQRSSESRVASIIDQMKHSDETDESVCPITPKEEGL
ncbi:28S ribosomal protein S23, mitochondrial-like [Rana temporaria]|uniref:28S ribosomal protein S23, mitochondrial-like n=1 Tax=Rana temporaria TaxID=8407 RepID=UPI001AADAF79|nr:28S ribosomal protein S23, mitochondrial-like [Rana temporaria]